MLHSFVLLCTDQVMVQCKVLPMYCRLEVQQQQHQHSSSSEAPATCDNHMHIHIVSDQFQGLSDAERQNNVKQVGQKASCCISILQLSKEHVYLSP